MREIAIRPATEQDYPSFVRLFPELMVGDPVPGREKWRDEIAPSALIAERDGRVLGYAYFQTIGSTGCVQNIVVAPEARTGRREEDHGRAALALPWQRPGELGAQRQTGQSGGHRSV